MNMRKGFVLAVLPFFVLCGCTTSAGYGAYAGAGLGSILGSAIGGQIIPGEYKDARFRKGHDGN